MSDDTVVSQPAALPSRGFAIGQRLGERYEIRELLGEGGMGAVYRAHDDALGDDVALKVVRGGVDDAVLADEVRLAQKVTHANVCRTYDLEVVDGHRLVKMEYVAGNTLAVRIAAGRVPVGEAISIARGIAAGLAAAHRAGVVHRDLKPANVMLAGERVVLMDFGLASQAAEATTSGTPGYMAPEQLAGADVDARADLYALGCVLYELLAGEAVFGGTPMERIARHASLPAPDVRVERPDAPRWLAHATALLLAKAPARRPHGAAVLARGPRSLRMPAIVAGAAAIAAIAYLVRSPAAAPVDADADAQALLARGAELVDIDPLAAVATVAPLARTSHWLEVRGIVEAARPAGIPFAIATDEPVYDLQLSLAHPEVLGRGRNGGVWKWDLDARTGVRILDDKFALVRFAPDGTAVIEHRRGVAILAGTARRDVDLPLPEPGELDVGDGVAFVANRSGPLWRIDLASGTASQVDLPAGWSHIAVAPDGRRVAVYGKAGCAIADARAIPSAPVAIVTGNVGEVAWSKDSDRFAAHADKEVVVRRVGETEDEQRIPAPLAFPLGFDLDNHVYFGNGVELRVYGPNPIAFPGRPGFTLRGPDMMILAEQSRDRVRLVFGIGGSRDLSARAPILGLVANARSPYLVASTGDHLLVWRVDDIAPHRVLTTRANEIIPVGEKHVVAFTGSKALYADAETGHGAAFDVERGPSETVGAAFRGDVLAVPEYRQLSFLGPGGQRQTVQGDYDIVFMLDDGHAVVGDFARTWLADLAAHSLTPFHDGLVVGAVHAGPWVVIRLADDSLVRRDTRTGHQDTLPGQPVASQRAAFGVFDDGTVVIGIGYTMTAWDTDGSMRTIATLRRPIQYVGPRGRRIAVSTGESQAYVVAVDAIQDVRAPARAWEADGDPLEMLAAAKLAGGVQLADQLVGRSWLQLASDTADTLAISADRTYLYVQSPTGVAAWNIDAPRSADATAKWIDAMTNARIDPATRQVVWP